MKNRYVSKCNEDFYMLMLKIIRKSKKRISLFFILSFCVLLLCIAIPQIISKIIDFGILKANTFSIIKYSSYLIVIEISVGILQFVVELIEFNMIAEFRNDSEIEVFERLLCLKMDYINTNGTNKIVGDMLLYIEELAELLTGGIIEFLLEMAKIIGYFIGIYNINPQLAIYVFCFVPFKLLLVLILRKRISKMSEKMIKSQSEFSKWKQDNFEINSIFEIKMWDLNEIKIQEYKESLADVKGASRNLFINKSLLYDGVRLCQTIFIDLFYFVGGVMIINKNLEVGQLIAFITYMSLFLSPIDSFMALIIQVNEAIPAIRKYLDFFDLDFENDIYADDISIKSIDTIEFKNISYDVENNRIIDDVSFLLKKGDRVAIWGLNGSGKTSILKLMTKIIEPTKGEILINGVSYRKISYKEIRRVIAYMSQNPFLYNDTIKNNIYMHGKSNINEKYKDLVLFVDKFKNGINHKVGAIGNKVSGGERQKISLLRTLGKKSRMLILDEPDSELDLDSKKNLELIIKDESYDIIISIVHDYERLSLFNKIIHLEGGKIQGDALRIQNKKLE
ncbi:ABC transporter ATP-binding protein [Lachnoanaerobaculum sp. Marseille-Q4761]|jgi:hypothetical protein|uniref:ABC transporter ATP-binding protein n=1 Tax=Lachnoanaerobaculum sp. Marseille-Q4761 TaxID=2819511 RepID=UPI001AA0F9F1|nr:ABC transporter ATP-binding protein [Lachnoanaerobaculum sp. Marseille-Q4761]MBO1872118.1 ABC transporter ATP-binding protein [Lachnoanaerobaculum sp. Marseille-Q4761]